MTTTAYTNAHFFDGEHEGFTPDSWFTVDNETGRVTANGTGKAPAADATVDFGGQYEMPGMINCHTHMASDPNGYGIRPMGERSETENSFNAQRNLRDAIKGGVTYIRDVGSTYDIDIKMRDMRSKYDFPAPGIAASGRAMSVTGGHSDTHEPRSADFRGAYIVDSPDEMRKAARQAFKNGADQIKVMATGGVMSVGDDPNEIAFTPEELREAVREAHYRFKKVAAHAQGNAGIQVALEAGVDSIEHGIYMDEKQADFMIEHHVYLVPTLNAVEAIVADQTDRLPAHMYRKARAFSEAFYDNMRMAVRKHVPIATGTDAGTPFNDFKSGYWHELDLMVNRIGATTQETLFAATKNGADLIGISDDYGTMTPGKFADFIVMTDSPIEDIHAVQQEDKQVYQHGKRVY